MRTSTAPSGDTVLVFPGRGSQATEPLIELLDTDPVFTDQMRWCEAALGEFIDWSLLDTIRGGDTTELMRDGVAEPINFSALVSLAARKQASGLRPDAVLGHSDGEIAAAYVAGALSLRDAAKVVALRSKAAEAAGIRAVLNDDAAHIADSAACDELRDMLRDTLADVRPQVGDVVFISSVTGAGLDPSILDGDYWFANLRQPALFEPAVHWAYGRGFRTFVDLSPQAVLTADIQRALAEFAVETTVGS
jgi:polyketide synthase 12